MKHFAKRHYLILIAVCFAAVGLVGISDPTAGWELYTDTENQVRFRHPKEWKLDRHSHETATYFSGSDGSVLVSAEGYDTPEVACRMNAEHKGMPFGIHYKIRRLKVQGQSACIVWPSQDQQLVGEAVNAPYALVVVQRPHPVTWDKYSYPLLTVYGDTKHITDIVGTLKFIPRTQSQH